MHSAISRVLRAAGLALLVSTWATAADVVEIVDRFCGLNDTDAAVTIPQCAAQSALNVEGNTDGTALLKRKGFVQEAALTIATSPVTGAMTFYDSSGNKLDVVCHDRFCSKSTNNSAFSNFLSTGGGTGNLPTRWSFVTVDSILYGANDRRDAVLRYDNVSSSHPTSVPAGSILALTPDRLVVADTSANPNRVSYSKSGAFTNFVEGTADVDSWHDDIGASGDKITVLKYDRGKLYVGKRDSITVCDVDNQYTTYCSILSDTVGSTDPQSWVSTPAGLFFRSQFKSYWRIGPGGLELVSRSIKRFVEDQSSGQARSNTQTSQANWDAGSQAPSGSWNTDTLPGSVFPSSSTSVDTSSTNFSDGTMVNASTAVAGAVYFTAYGTQTFVNAGAESNDATNWPTKDWSIGPGEHPSSEYFGSKFWESAANITCSGSEGVPFKIEIINSASGSVILSTSMTILFNWPTMSEHTVNISSLAASMIKYKVTGTQAGAGGTTLVNTSTAIIKPQTLKFRVGNLTSGTANCWLAWDLTENNLAFITSGTFTSRAFDTEFTTPTWGPPILGLSSTSAGGISFQAQSSSNGSTGWSARIGIDTFTAMGVAQNRYIRYIASFTVTTATDTAPGILDVSLPYATTGQYVSQCIQPASNISAWGILSCAESKSGNGSLVYYATSAATCAGLPTTWASATNNGTIGISTGAAMKFRFDSLLGSSTDQAQVDACTVYWNEGSVAPPVWSAYDGIRNSVYWSLSTGTASSNNRVLKLDLNQGTWYPFDLSASAFNFKDGELYFGSSSGGYWNKYGNVDTDSGTAISAHWQSKDFYSGLPYNEKAWKNVSLLTRNEQRGSLSVTWSLDRGSSGAYSISLSTDSTKQYIRSNYNLPLASPATLLNVKFSNSSANQPFQILGYRIGAIPYDWKVLNP